MKLRKGMAVALAAVILAGALVSSSAWAQGTFNRGRHPSSGFGNYVAPREKPYVPPDEHAGSSLWEPSVHQRAQPSLSGGAGANWRMPTDRSVFSDPSRYMYPKPTRDCELSVYVNACDKRRR